jgi:hypothetical protein
VPRHRAANGHGQRSDRRDHLDLSRPLSYLAAADQRRSLAHAAAAACAKPGTCGPAIPDSERTGPASDPDRTIGGSIALAQLLAETGTTALLVMHRGRIVWEH